MDNLLPTKAEQAAIASGFVSLKNRIQVARDKLHRGPLARSYAVMNTQIELGEAYFWFNCVDTDSHHFAKCSDTGEIALLPHDDKFLPKGWEWYSESY